MTKEREVWVDGCLHHVVLSDEKETLLAAKAAGRVIVGLLHPAGEDGADGKQGGIWADLSPARYLVEDPAVDVDFLERVVRREKGLPWIIAEGGRLIIREFTMDDIGRIMKEPEDTEEDAVFYTPELLESYIRDQYGFYECGMWAVVRRSDGVLLGKAGIANGGFCLELGYHIFAPYRRQGYAKEACRMVLGYVRKEYWQEEPERGGGREGGGYAVGAWTESGNAASVHLLQSLGFCRTECFREPRGVNQGVRSRKHQGCGQVVDGRSGQRLFTGQKCNGSRLQYFRYVGNC